MSTIPTPPQLRPNAMPVRATATVQAVPPVSAGLRRIARVTLAGIGILGAAWFLLFVVGTVVMTGVLLVLGGALLKAMWHDEQDGGDTRKDDDDEQARFMCAWDGMERARKGGK